MKITKTPKRLAEPMREVKQLVQRITEADDDELPDILSGISEWCWPRGDLHYWISVLNRFDSILEEACRDYDLHKLQINEFTPLRKRILVSILKFTRLLVENCTSRKLYASYEHLNNLLFTRDIDVLEATLRVILRFSQQHSSQHPKAELVIAQDKLATLAVTWSPRDHGLDMVDVAKDELTIPPSLMQIRFQFYRRKQADKNSSSINFTSMGQRTSGEGSTSMDESINTSSITPTRQRSRVNASSSSSATPMNSNLSALPDTSAEAPQEGLTVIELGNPMELGSNAMDVLADAIEKYEIPQEDHFELYLKIRLSMSMHDPIQRRKLIICRLLAIAAYAHDVPESVATTQLFLYEPEIIPRLAALINPQNSLPDDIVSGSLYAMDALGRYRNKLQDMLSSLNASVNHGILLQVLRNITEDLSTGVPTVCDEYVDAYFGLVSFITSTNTGSGLVVGAGLLQLLIKLIDTAKPESYMIQRSVTRAIGLLDSVIYAYVPAFNLFCVAHGLEIFVRRIEEEVKFDIELANSKMDEGEDIGPDQLFGKLTFGRAHLLRGFLQSISHMMTSTGTTDGLRNLIDSSLVGTIKLIMEHRRIIGPQNLALAISIMATFVHNEPTSLGTIQEKKLPETFLATVQEDIEAHFDVINAIPNAIGALCLNQAGLDMFSNDIITNKLLSLLTSERHSKVLQDQDNITAFGASIDELIRHQPSMKQSVRTGIFKVLEAIQEAGKAFVVPTSDQEDKPWLYVLSKVSSETVDAEGSKKTMKSTENGEMIAHRSMALADIVMDETDVLVRKEDALKESNLVVSYMDITCRFLEVLFQTQSHCQDFLRAEGLKKLLQFYTLPCLPYNFATSIASDSLVHLLRFITEFSANSVMSTLLKEVKASIEETKPLWNLTEEESTLAKLLKPSTDEQLKTCNDKFRMLVRLNARVQLLSDVVPAFCHSGSKTPATSMLQVLHSVRSNSDGKDDVITLPELGDFMRAWTWETVLLKSLTQSTSKALRLHEDDKDSSADSKQDSFESSNSLARNTVSLRYIASHVKVALQTFFTETNKLYTSRKTHDSGHRRLASLTASQIGTMLNKNMEWRDHSNLRLSCDYMIVMISQATKLLYDERSSSSTHTQTIVLLTFVKQGGLTQLLGNYQRFSDELDKYYESRPNTTGEAEMTDEILHSSGGLRWASELLSKMVSHAPLLDSPSTAIIKSTNKDGLSEPFEPRAFLINMRLAIAPVIRQTWSKDWLTKASLSIVQTIFKIILKLAEGQGEAPSAFPPPPRLDPTGGFSSMMGVGSASAGLLSLAQAMSATVQGMTGHAPGGIRQRNIPTVDESRLRQLTDMGFPRRAARHALVRCGNNLSAATEYLLMHPEIVASIQGGDAPPVADGVPASDSTAPSAATENASVATGTTTEGVSSEAQGAQQQTESTTAPNADAMIPTETAAPAETDVTTAAAANGDTPMTESNGTATEDAEDKKKAAKQKEKEREKESKEVLAKEQGLLQVQRDAICETLLVRSLEVCDQFESLVFEARNAIRIITVSYSRVEPLQNLFQSVSEAASQSRSDKMKFVSVRLHLLALIFADKEGYALQCAHLKAKEFLAPLLRLIESFVDNEDSNVPTWMASLFLVLSAILQAEDSIPDSKLIDKDDRTDLGEMPKMWEESSLAEELPRLLSFSLQQLKQVTKLPRGDALALYRFVVTLTRRPVQAEQFIKQGGLELTMKPFCSEKAKGIANCRPFAVLILRHIVESHPEILQATIKLEVRSFFCQSRLKAMDTTSVTNSLGPAILREPDVFLNVVKENLELVDYKSGQGIIKLALPQPIGSDQNTSAINDQQNDISQGSTSAQGTSSTAFAPPLEGGADDSMDLIPPSPTKQNASINADSQMLEVGGKSLVKEEVRVDENSPARLEIIVHFLLSELMQSIKKRSELMAKKDSDATKETDKSGDQAKVADAHYFYVCFLLQSLTELLSSYKACKVSFLTFTEKYPTYLAPFIGSKKRESSSKVSTTNSIMSFFLAELIPLGFIQSKEQEELRRLMSISNWAMSAIVALCAEVVSNTFDLKELGGQEIVMARKTTLDGIAKAIREASSQRNTTTSTSMVETTEARYGRLYVLSDLCYRLLKARPNSIGNSTTSHRPVDDFTLHMAKTMLERNFVTVLTNALAEVDLNLPMVKSLLDRILKPLEHLTRVAIKMNKAQRDNDKRKAAAAANGSRAESAGVNIEDEEMDDNQDEEEDEEDDEESNSEGEGEEDEEDRQETPDFYRNSSLGMHTGELENAVNYEGDEDGDDDDDDDEDEEMDEDMEGVVYSDGDTDDSDDDGDDVDEEHIIEVMEEDDADSQGSTDSEDQDDDQDEAGSWVDEDDEGEDEDGHGHQELDFVIEGDLDDSHGLMERADRLLQGVRGGALGEDDEDAEMMGPGSARITYDIHEVHGEFDDEDDEDDDEGEIMSSQGEDDEDGSMLEGIFTNGDMPGMVVPSSHDYAQPADRFGAIWSFTNVAPRPDRQSRLSDGPTNQPHREGEIISPLAFLGRRSVHDRTSRAEASQREFEEVMDAMMPPGTFIDHDAIRRQNAPWRESGHGNTQSGYDIASHPLLMEPTLQSDLQSNGPTVTTASGRSPWVSSMRRGNQRGMATFAQSLDSLMGANAAQFLETLLQREGAPPVRPNEALHISVRPGHMPLVTIGGPPRERLRDNESVVTLNSNTLPAFSPIGRDLSMMNTVLVVQEFTPMPTMSRWSEDMRIVAGSQVDYRLRAMRLHIVNTLRPAWLVAQDALKKKKELQEEERKKVKAAETAAKAKAKAKEEEEVATTSAAANAATSAPSTVPGEQSTSTTSAAEGITSEIAEASTAALPVEGDVEMAEEGAAINDATSQSENLPANLELNSLQQGLEELDSSQLAAAQRAREEAASTAAPAESSNEVDNSTAPTEADVTAPLTEAASAPPAARVTTTLNGNEIDITDSGIDPTFLEALPEDMREEVLNQHFRERRAAEAAAALAAGGPGRLVASSRIAPEFLEALPPEIRAEVIQQEAAEEQRRRREERRNAAAAAAGGDGGEGGGENRTTGPSDIDTASFLATLNPDLRGAVLLEQDPSFLESMPDAIRQEVEALRRTTQQSRDSRRRQLYATGGSGPGPLPVLNAAMGSRSGNLLAEISASGHHEGNSKKSGTPRDAIQLLDKAGIAALVRLLFFPQMDSSSSGLREVLVNLSENAKSRFEVLNLLLMILAEGASAETNAVDKSYNNVSGRINKGVSFQTPSRPAPPRRSTATTTSTPAGNQQQAILVSPTSATPSSIPGGIMNAGQSALIAPLSRAGDEAPFLIASRSIETLVHLTSANEQAAQYFLKDDPSNVALMKWFKKSSGNVKGKEREKVTSNAPINILLVLLAKPSILANAQLVDSLMTLLNTVTRPLPSIVASRKKAEEDRAKKEAPVSIPVDNMKKEEDGTAKVEEEKKEDESKEKEASTTLTNTDGLPPAATSLQDSTSVITELPPAAPQISEDRMAAVVKPLSISISSKGFQNTLAVASNLSSIDGAMDIITCALQREANTAGSQLMIELDELLESLPIAPTVEDIEGVVEDGEEADRLAAIERGPGAAPINPLIQRGREESSSQPISSPALTKLASPSSSQTVILRSLRALEWVLTRPKSSIPNGASSSQHSSHQGGGHHHRHQQWMM